MILTLVIDIFCIALGMGFGFLLSLCVNPDTKPLMKYIDELEGKIEELTAQIEGLKPYEEKK